MNRKEIEKLLFLSRLRAEEEEIEKISEDVSSILSYVDKLKSADTKGVDPLFHFTEIKNIAREDKFISTPKEIRKAMMSMGKDENDFLRVESIL